jgi:hypothetical protein
MYQFRREDMAVQAARLLATYERQPIVIMARGFMNLFTIGPLDNAVVHEAGRHMATVYRSGLVRWKHQEFNARHPQHSNLVLR